MAVHDLFPGYGDVRYHSSFGVHHKIVPTRAWYPTPLIPLNVLGQYNNWGEIGCDGEAMWDEFVAQERKWYPATCTIDSVTVYTIAEPGAPAIPRATKSYGLAGTFADPGWSKAVQRTWVMRDTEFLIVKSVMLDCASGDSFDRVVNISGSTESLDYVGMWTSPSWAFSSRAGNRPNSFQSVVTGINDKLSKEYGNA
jgi:hypothetical protein